MSSSESSAPPTTSIGSSSSFSSLSEELLRVCPRCCEMYSALSASKSTVIPFARNFRACLSMAFAIFFRRRALLKRDLKVRKVFGLRYEGF